MIALFLLILASVLVMANFLTFKFSGTNRKRRIWSGVIFLILTPMIFYITALTINPFDPYGFGTGVFSVLYAFSFLVNGLILIFLGFLTKGNNAIANK
ncbi:MAG: hypothetical protein ACO1OT_16050 [Heyndrickxia sp.]